MNISRTNPAYFELTLFIDYGNLRYLFFALCLLIYMTIVSANMVIIITILLEKSLHQPMYVFICCLSVNSLYGSAGFFPRFLADLLSDSHFISRPSCFIQIYVIYTYASCEFTILGIMAYDRFVAICQPLHYSSKMTIPKALCLWAAGVVYPAIFCGVCLYLSIKLPLCGYKLHRIFCSNWPVVQISCVDTTLNSIVGQCATLTTIFIPLLFVLYSYMRILIVCKTGSLETRRKALQTCVPHLVTFMTYSTCLFCELSMSRFDGDKVNPYVVAVLSLEYLVIPSLNNPFIYGLHLPQIRTVIFRHFKIRQQKGVQI
ncbi:olfactory receptor 51L1-like [Boleophthalmus pectinirostris]|uniref:olfactory receptor 51L1-like n=1 Tax=Boleophthalmus pectinirostris TaxID=150288 RepID=UPI002431B26E|nr:olfactory receptor 51L1-like [Boleophthalmus pectinirostris]